MATSRVRDILPKMKDLKIKVRISRMWRGKLLTPVEKPDGLGCVLIDQYGDIIHAMVMEADVEDVQHNVTEGSVYEINKFRVVENQKTHQIVPHRAQLLFNNKTEFIPIPTECSEIPTMCFNLIDYNDLPLRLNNDTILTATTKGRLSKKREIIIQNTRNEELKITLWGNLGLDFEVDTILKMPPPVVIVVTSSKVAKFSDRIVLSTSLNSCIYINPDISELQNYKRRFSTLSHVPKLITALKPAPTSDAIDTSNIISISELIVQDIDENKDSTFTCRAKITKIIPKNGWYYIGCPTCRVKLQPGEDSTINTCHQHGMQIGIPIYKMQIRLEDEDDSTLAMLIGKPAEKLFNIPCSKLLDQENTDPTVIPPTILSFQNIYKIWQLGIGIRKDFVVRAVYEENKQTEQKMEQGPTSEDLPHKCKSQPPEDSTLKQVLEDIKKPKREAANNSKKKLKLN